MKRIVCFMVALCLMVMPGFVAMAETAPFDHKAFEGMDGYSYDKFSKNWKYYKAYSENYSDAFILFGMQVESTEAGGLFPTIYCWIRDASNSHILYTVKAIQILIDDTLYSFNRVLEGEGESTVFLGNSSKPLIEAMAAANEISVRLSWNISSWTMDIAGTDYTKEFKVIAQQILDYNVLDYLEERMLVIEEVLPLEIN